MVRILVILISVISCTIPVSAQMLAGKVVADCTAGNPTPVTVGTTIPLAVDVNGKLCTNATGGGGAVTQSGVWSTRTQDGAGNALTSIVAGATRSLDVVIRDAAGNLIVPSGSGAPGYTQGSTTAGQSGPLDQGAVTTAAPTYTTATTAPFSLTTSGDLRVAPSAAVIQQVNDAAIVTVFPGTYGATATSYVAGRAIGGILTFGGAFRTAAATKSGTITRVMIVNGMASVAPLRLYLFEQSTLATVTCTNNVAFSWGTAGSGVYLEHAFDITPAVDVVGGNLAYGVADGAWTVRHQTTGTDIFGCLVAQGTFDLTSSNFNVWIRLFIERH